MNRHRTNGKVKSHAIDRVRGNYKSPASDKEIRRALREDLCAFGDKNGWAPISEETVRKLRMQVKGVVLAVVTNGQVITVIDKEESERIINGYSPLSPLGIFMS